MKAPDGTLSIGAAVSLNDLSTLWLELSSQSGFGYLKEAGKFLEKVASIQIRNVRPIASFVGGVRVATIMLLDSTVVL